MTQRRTHHREVEMRVFALTGAILFAHAGGGSGGCGGGNGHDHDHHPDAPAPYAGMENPYEGDEAAIAAGEALWGAHCVDCHGDEGKGDGPGATGLSPAPTDLTDDRHAHLPDDYLHWRIAEGGGFEPFSSAMPAFGSELSEQQIWELVSYIRHLVEEAGHDHHGHDH
jgi:mono/diheme cytochrome c family protein